MFKRARLIITLGSLLVIAIIFRWNTWQASQRNAPLNTGSSASSTATPTRVQTTVLHVLDGDTIIVSAIPGVLGPNNPAKPKQHTVRLLGIDAPEMHPDGSSEPACGAQAATERLKALATRKTTIELIYDAHSDAHDRYGRSLTYVEIKDGNTVYDLGARLLEEGLVAAWHPRSTAAPERFASYQRIQNNTAAAGHGSWGHCHSLGR